MKIFFKLTMIALLSAFVLSGCGGNKSSNNSGPENELENRDVVKSDGSFDTGEEVIEKKQLLSPEEADFRALKWGMTKAEVKEVEGTGYDEPQNYILYYTRVREEGYPADAEYRFADDKLVQGEFFIFDNKEGKTVEFSDYESLVDSLKSRFGTPLQDEKTFIDEADANKGENAYIDLVMKNKMIRRTKWIIEDKNTELRVVLHKRNGKICIGLQYKQIGANVPKD